MEIWGGDRGTVGRKGKLYFVDGSFGKDIGLNARTEFLQVNADGG